MFTLAPEFSQHQATYLAWPHAPETWPECMASARASMANFIALVAGVEPVRLLVLDSKMEEQAKSMILEEKGDLEQVSFHRVAYDDSWLRDTFPLFAKDANGKAVLLQKVFNSWGQKFPPWQADAKLGNWVARETGLAEHDLAIVLEGGALEWNGEGLLLTTEECLLEPKRNPGMSKAAYEELFRGLGIENTLWLNKGLEHDHTDGHVDNLIRFLGPKCLVMALTDQSGEENLGRLEENLPRAQAFAQKHGLSLHFLPDAGTLEKNGQLYPRSYANFYMANGLVVVPTFGQASDGLAIELLQSLCPDRKVVGLDAQDIIIGGGAFHCLTMFCPSA